MWCYFVVKKCKNERCITCLTYKEYRRKKEMAYEDYQELQMEERRLEALVGKEERNAN